MNSTRTGKIARLPEAVREQLNRRLQDGEQAKKLVQWLNRLPEVRAVVDHQFGGRPIREQNLSEWRKGGYRDWLLDREAAAAVLRVSREAGTLVEPDQPLLTDTLARWLATRYALATHRLNETDDAEQWRLLRELCADVVELRRGDHTARRLELERARTEAVERDAEMKWKRRIIVGLETLEKTVRNNPAALTAFNQLVDAVRHPFDPTESG